MSPGPVTMAQLRRRAGAALMLLLVMALGACAGRLAGAYRPESGPYPVAVWRDAALAIPGSERRLPLRIAWPAGSGGPYPVVVFSHGGGSSRDMYDRMADHWASAGYVVILPSHADSAANGFRMGGVSTEDMLGVIESRRRDMSLIVDSLAGLQATVPGLAGKVDPGRVVAAGHSLGGATAMTVTGVELYDPRDGRRYGYRDERFDALLLITDPGHSPMAPEDPWRAAPVPVFVATGSKDYSGQWQGPPRSRLYTFVPGLEWPRNVPHYYLFVDGMDHYIGGLICRNDKGPPDPDALDIVNAASTAFLDAYTKSDRRALQFLRSSQIGPVTGGRATLSLQQNP